MAIAILRLAASAASCSGPESSPGASGVNVVGLGGQCAQSLGGRTQSLGRRRRADIQVCCRPHPHGELSNPLRAEPSRSECILKPLLRPTQSSHPC